MAPARTRRTRVVFGSDARVIGAPPSVSRGIHRACPVGAVEHPRESLYRRVNPRSPGSEPRSCFRQLRTFRKATFRAQVRRVGRSPTALESLFDYGAGSA